MTQSPGPFRFPASHRLSGTLQFAAVFDGKCRKSVGPLTLVARPNALPHNRLGCSVSRRVGTAVKRNRIKRLLREAYRLDQHEWCTRSGSDASAGRHHRTTVEGLSPDRHIAPVRRRAAAPLDPVEAAGIFRARLPGDAGAFHGRALPVRPDVQPVHDRRHPQIRPMARHVARPQTHRPLPPLGRLRPRPGVSVDEES